jgi:TolA-binding protein
MKKIFVACCTLLLSGCLGFNPQANPQLQQKIDNQNGKIDEIRNNQNGISVELGQLRQNSDIQNSQLKEVQQGMVNLNTAISRNENSGVQILQGDGPLILVFGLGVIGMLLFYFHNRATKAEKTAEILAREIARTHDPILESNVLRAALHTENEGHIYRLLTKHKKII